MEVEEWEKKAQAVLIDTSKSPLDEENPQYSTLASLSALLAEGTDIEAALPSYHALQSAITHAKDWLHKVCTRLLYLGTRIQVPTPSIPGYIKNNTRYPCI